MRSTTRLATLEGWPTHVGVATPLALPGVLAEGVVAAARQVVGPARKACAAAERQRLAALAQSPVRLPR